MAAADRTVVPSREDALVAASSTAIGGPLGAHARPHPWWTPLRVVLALVTLAGVLNLAHTAPCQSGAWWSGAAYADLCYSDVPLSYAGSGAAEGRWPYAESDGRYLVSTDPAPVAALAWLAAGTGRVLSGGGGADSRAARPVSDLSGDPEVQREAVTYYAVYALVMVAMMLVIGAVLVRLAERRPWDAAAFAVAPVLVLAATIGWDLLGVAAAVGGLSAWSRRRTGLCGALLGTATAIAVWPLAVVLALLVLAGRARWWRAGLMVTGTTAGGWVLWQVPVLLLAPDAWWATVNHTLGGVVGYGSLWRFALTYGAVVSPARLVALVVFALALVVAAVLALALTAHRPPRVPQVVLLLLLGALWVWPVYSPQYVLWLLPFAVLARPLWRDLLIWQAGEVFYFLAIWWTLAGATTDAGSDDVYAAAIVARVLAQMWLAAMVVRDILRPGHDPVRAVPAPPAPPSPTPPPSAARYAT